MQILSNCGISDTGGGGPPVRVGGALSHVNIEPARPITMADNP